MFYASASVLLHCNILHGRMRRLSVAPLISAPLEWPFPIGFYLLCSGLDIYRGCGGLDIGWVESEMGMLRVSGVLC